MVKASVASSRNDAVLSSDGIAVVCISLSIIDANSFLALNNALRLAIGTLGLLDWPKPIQWLGYFSSNHSFFINHFGLGDGLVIHPEINNTVNIGNNILLIPKSTHHPTNKKPHECGAFCELTNANH